MRNVLIAVDLAKDVFELAVAHSPGRVVERKRLTRLQFERFWNTREPSTYRRRTARSPAGPRSSPVRWSTSNP